MIGFDATALRMVNILNSRSSYVSNLMEHIATGMRINTAADDPAGLAISEKMRAQIRGMNQAYRNVQDGISLIQVAEGSLEETHNILQRIRELVVQASNDTNSSQDRNAIQLEINQLLEEIDRISKTTDFNGIKLLDGSISDSTEGLHIQDGPNAGDSTILKIQNMGAKALGIADLSVLGSSSASISDMLKKVDDAIGKVSAQRAYLGAKQNAIEHRLNYLETSSINLQEAESRIRDLDITKAIMELSKNIILMQVGQAILMQFMKTKRMQILYLLKSL